MNTSLRIKTVNFDSHEKDYLKKIAALKAPLSLYN